MVQKPIFNVSLRDTLASLHKKKKENAELLPAYDTENTQGKEAYSLSDELQLLGMLNTCRLEPQAYRTIVETIQQLYGLISKVAAKDAYLVAQMIVWSRCCGAGLRSVNQLAAAMLAPYISGTDWGKRFYGAFDKTSKTPKGGVVYRLDDMSEIKDFHYWWTGRVLSNAMRKGFNSVLLNADSYSLAKYKKTVVDMSNLTHPNPWKAKAWTEIGDHRQVKTLWAIMQDFPIQAETWETAQSEAGQLVAEAVREGTLNEDEAANVLRKAKHENWKQLLQEGKLGILAAIRNLRNILEVDDDEVADMVCKLVSDGEKIRKGKIMPYQLEMAQTMVAMGPGGFTANGRKVWKALEEGMTAALPNLAELAKGKNLVILDCSGSMHSGARMANRTVSTCMEKASIIAAMLAKATNADVVVFGSRAEYVTYNPEQPLSVLAREFAKNRMGMTNISKAFNLITEEQSHYDRIFLLSDNEANQGCLRSSYLQYLETGCDPHVYCVDLACYGTVPLRDDRGKVHFYNGYSYAMLDDIALLEFDPNAHILKVREVEI